jgi:hypothetical protein
MHPRQGAARFDDVSFGDCELLESMTHGLFVAKELCQANIGRMMSRFRFKKGIVKVGQLAILDVLAE